MLHEVREDSIHVYVQRHATALEKASARQVAYGSGALQGEGHGVEVGCVLGEAERFQGACDSVQLCDYVFHLGLFCCSSEIFMKPFP